MYPQLACHRSSKSDNEEQVKQDKQDMPNMPVTERFYHTQLHLAQCLCFCLCVLARQ
jgi:hypothetical protein